MRVVCYFINWNDSFYIPFLHKHYSAFCERIVMYDQYSNDGSRELVESLGIEVRNFGGHGVLNDQWYLDVKNNCWKECRNQGIDYVVVVDADEFVCIPQINIKGNEVLNPFPNVTGFNMISDTFPGKDIFEIKTGSPSESYSKQAIFNPDYVTEINYVHGCHKNHAVTGVLNGYWSELNCTLYHYRMIGGVHTLLNRHAVYRSRLSEFNKKFNMGHHYSHSDNAKIDEWNYLMSQATVLF